MKKTSHIIVFLSIALGLSQFILHAQQKDSSKITDNIFQDSIKIQPDSTRRALEIKEASEEAQESGTLEDPRSNPIPIKRVDPEQPQTDLRLKATVWIRILVDKHGKVLIAKVQKSDAVIFNQPCIDAALKWKFQPGRLHGDARAAWLSIPFKIDMNRRSK